MARIRQVYAHLDSEVWRLPRSKYAILTGVIAALGNLVITLALGNPNYAFAIGTGLTLTVLSYWYNPNQKEE